MKLLDLLKLKLGDELKLITDDFWDDTHNKGDVFTVCYVLKDSTDEDCVFVTDTKEGCLYLWKEDLQHFELVQDDPEPINKLGLTPKHKEALKDLGENS